MDIQITDTSETRKEVVVQLSPEDIQTSRSKIVGDFCQHARLPGFRPGKAPEKIVLKKFQKEILDELSSSLLRRAFEKFDQEGGLEILSIIRMDKPDPNADEPALRMIIDVKPPFNLPAYEGIAVEKERVVVVEKDVDDVIDYLRSQRADYKPAERAAAPGDMVRLSYEGKIGDQPVAELVAGQSFPGKMENTWEQVAEEDGYGVPGMARALAGLAAGGKFPLEVTFPADHSVEPLQGKTATYEVEVHEVRERILPEVNDAFAQSMKEESLESLRQSIHGNLMEQKANDAENRMRGRLTESLISSTSFPVPESLLERETQGLLTNFMRSHLERGASPEDFEKQKESLYAGAAETAGRTIRLQLILDAIAREKEIVPTDEELVAYVYEVANRTRRSPDELIKELKQDPQRLREMQNDARRRKTVEYLAEKASITEVDPTPPATG